MSEPKVRAALVIAHPGHELRVFHWLERTRPLVSVLTDGSGPNRESRLGSTERLLEQAGAACSPIFGVFSDRKFYETLLAGDPAPFKAVAVALVDQWREHEIDLVAGDMLEGFNTAHDVCRLLINAAIERGRRYGIDVRNFEFPLEALTLPAAPAAVVELDDAAFQRKRETAMANYPEVASEVERMIAKHGERAFRREALYPGNGSAGLTWEGTEPPFYEVYGARQVKAGHYRELITYRDHMQPLARALQRWAEGNGGEG